MSLRLSFEMIQLLPSPTPGDYSFPSIFKFVIVDLLHYRFKRIMMYGSGGSYLFVNPFREIWISSEVLS
jgi:branched-subunit amino acid transport protein AzlD